jgi:hypothetical protein
LAIRAGFDSGCFDRPFGHNERFEKSVTPIFLCCIFLLAKPKKKNAAQKNMKG